MSLLPLNNSIGNRGTVEVKCDFMPVCPTPFGSETKGASPSEVRRELGFGRHET